VSHYSSIRKKNYDPPLFQRSGCPPSLGIGSSHSFVCVNLCGCVWICVDLCGFVWICVDLCGFVWICVDLCGFVWICVDLCGFLRASFLKAKINWPKKFPGSNESGFNFLLRSNFLLLCELCGSVHRSLRVLRSVTNLYTPTDYC